MRVVHVVARSQRRGAESFALELAHELDALGHENRITALGLDFEGGRDPELPPLVDTAELGPAVLARSAVRLRPTMRDPSVDVVLAHGGSAIQVAGLARRRAGPVIVWQRILDFPATVWRPSRRVAWRAIAGRADAVVALTDHNRDEVRRLGYPGPIWVIPNTRRPDRFVSVDRTGEAARMRHELGLAAETPVLGFVGHLVAQKRPERALEVLERVLDSGRELHLVVAGHGPLRAALEEETSRRGLTSRVSLLGHRDDVERVYGAIDLLVLTSDAEGIPGVAIEAQMAGCPVVTFPVGGVSEVVDHQRTGLVLARAETALMAAEVVRLLDDAAGRRQLGDEGRRRAGWFTVAAAAREYADRLSALVTATRALRAGSTAGEAGLYP